MKQLKKDLNAVMKELKALTRKTEGIEKKLEKLEKSKVPKKPKAKVKAAKKRVAKQAKRASAIDTLFAIIKRSRKGVTATALKKKTGFDGWKLYDGIYKLKKQGKIKSAGKGFYVKV